MGIVLSVGSFAAEAGGGAGFAVEEEEGEEENAVSGCWCWGFCRGLGVMERCLRAACGRGLAGFADPLCCSAHCHRNGSRLTESFAPGMLIIVGSNEGQCALNCCMSGSMPATRLG